MIPENEREKVLAKKIQALTKVFSKTNLKNVRIK